MGKKLRYRLHWASGNGPRPAFKWTIYDWNYFCPVVYAETRINGRKICDFLNELEAERNAASPACQENR